MMRLAKSPPMAAGNTYGYDAEGRMKSAAGVTYTIDGLGLRVNKSSGELDWFGQGSILFETDASGNVTKEYISFGSLRIARRDSTGTVITTLLTDWVPDVS
jgi:hypothetical protein